MSKRLAILLSMCLFGAVGVVPVASGYKIPPTCKVPNVVHKTLSAAASAIDHAHCSVGTVTAQESSKVPKNHVISQSPGSGTSGAVGLPVDLVVSIGKPKKASCVVPKVVGKSQTQAELAVVNADCSIGKETTKSDKKVKSGNVISQSPKPGKKGKVGLNVDLTISSGPKK